MTAPDLQLGQQKLFSYLFQLLLFWPCVIVVDTNSDAAIIYILTIMISHEAAKRYQVLYHKEGCVWCVFTDRNWANK